MKKQILKLVVLLATITLSSCSKNDEEKDSLNDFSGYYKIASIVCSVPLDMNNNGQKSNDYLQEVKSTYTMYTGESINFGYDNALSANYAEARPNFYQSNNTKFLNIQFPIQRIDSIAVGTGNYEVYNAEYTKMNTGFVYKFANNNIEIESDPFDHLNFYNISNFTINRLNKEEFEIQFDYNVYDFTENDWVPTQLKTRYIKTN